MYYLKRKILGKKLHSEAISELNIYKFSPWDLPDKSCLKSKDREWYFFCPRERKYASGDRMKRGTETGYWKTTGKDRNINYDGRVVGMVKTLVFHEGNAPRGKRTDWLIYEYRLDDKKLADDGVAQDRYVLYKVFKKNGPGPKNGAQYGAPFVEEEWDNDDSVIAIDALPHDGSSSHVITTTENQNTAASNSLINPVCRSGFSIGGSGATVQTSPDEALVDGLTHSMVTDTSDPPVAAGCSIDFTHTPDDDIAHLLAAFMEDGPSFPNEQGNYEVGENSHGKENIALPHVHGNDPFRNLSTSPKLSGGLNFSHGQGHNMNNVLAQDDMDILELNDLDTPLNFSVESGGFQEVPTDGSFAACNPDVFEQSGTSSTQHNFSANLGQIGSDANFPSSQTVFPGSSQCSMLPNSSRRPEGSTNVFPTGDAYQNIFSQGYTAGYNLHSFSYIQAEEFADAAKNPERGRSHNF